MKERVFKGYAVKKLILSLTLLLVLVVASGSVAAEFSAYSGNGDERVDINLEQADDAGTTELIGYRHIAPLRERFPEGVVSFSSRRDTMLTRGQVALPVRVCLTDESYPAFSGLKIIRGTYFSSKALALGRNVAVISRDLAERLFMSTDAVGNEITLFDETYTIVGLYQQPKTLLSLLGSDGSERVYVPFTSHMEMGSLPVETIFIRDRSLGEAGFKETMMEDILRKEMGIQTGAYRIIDYYGTETMASQWLSLFLFLAALWTALLLLGSSGRLLGEMKDFVVAGLRQDYLSGFLRKQFVRVLSYTGRLLGLVGLSVLLAIFARPRVYIPSQYLPYDNIFDISFYLGKAREAIQASNAMAGYIPAPMEHAFQTSSAMGFLLLLLMIPAFLSLVSALKLLKSLMYPTGRFMLMLLLSSVLAFIVLLLLSVSGIIELAVNAKSLVLPVLFCLVYFLRKGKAESTGAERMP